MPHLWIIRKIKFHSLSFGTIRNEVNRMKFIFLKNLWRSIKVLPAVTSYWEIRHVEKQRTQLDSSAWLFRVLISILEKRVAATSYTFIQTLLAIYCQSMCIYSVLLSRKKWYKEKIFCCDVYQCWLLLLKLQSSPLLRLARSTHQSFEYSFLATKEIYQNYRSFCNWWVKSL